MSRGSEKYFVQNFTVVEILVNIGAKPVGIVKGVNGPDGDTGNYFQQEKQGNCSAAESGHQKESRFPDDPQKEDNVQQAERYFHGQFGLISTKYTQTKTVENSK